MFVSPEDSFPFPAVNTNYCGLRTEGRGKKNEEENERYIGVGGTSLHEKTTLRRVIKL